MLALSFVVQPAYSVAQPAQPPKKGVITKAKEKWSAMKEAVKKGSAVLKANWQCITKGKGEKCSPDRYLSLQIIRNFVKGNSKAAKEGLQKMVQAHKDCWVPVLVMLVGAGFVTSGFLEDLFKGNPGITGAIGVGIVAFSPVIEFFVLSAVAGTTAEAAFTRALKWERIKKCMLVIGIDLPIVIALGWILYKMAYKYETSPEHINDKKREGMTFLHVAVRRGKVDLVKELLDKGADINAQNAEGNTPLHLAVVQGDMEIAKLLLQKGAKYDQKNKKGMTPLYGAVDKKNIPLVRILLQHGANSNGPVSGGFTPLHMAVSKGNQAIVELLVKYKADPNQPNNKGLTPFHFAVDKGYKNTAELLLNKGADPDKAAVEHWTPLHMTAHRGFPGITKVLLEKSKKSVNAKNGDGDTPLHIAAQKGFKGVAQALLTAGADANLVNNKGQRPDQLTTDADLQEMLKPKLEWKSQ